MRAVRSYCAPGRLDIGLTSIPVTRATRLRTRCRRSGAIARVTAQYRTLVQLVLTAASGEYQADLYEQEDKQQRTKMAGQDLLRYAIFVRLSLEHLVEQ